VVCRSPRIGRNHYQRHDVGQDQNTDGGYAGVVGQGYGVQIGRNGRGFDGRGEAVQYAEWEAERLVQRGAE
jgi:hypothetical protein